MLKNFIVTSNYVMLPAVTVTTRENVTSAWPFFQSLVFPFDCLNRKFCLINDFLETQLQPCLPTHYINNNTFTKLNVSLVLLNAFGQNVGDASPALRHESWEVPYKTHEPVSLELKIWETCINPRISWLKFTVEGIYSLSLRIDNETIINKVRS